MQGLTIAKLVWVTWATPKAATADIVSIENLLCVDRCLACPKNARLNTTPIHVQEVRQRTGRGSLLIRGGGVPCHVGALMTRDAFFQELLKLAIDADRVPSEE